MGLRMTQVPTLALEEPLRYVRKRLLRDDNSSLEIARQTGIPGSTIRSIRQDVHGAISFKVWLGLMTYLGVLS